MNSTPSTAVKLNTIATSRRTQKPVQSAMVIGKDILELISGGMYIDPMSMIREYIQNAVDAIDEATKNRKYRTKAPEIRLVIDHSNRGLSIRDNGAGIPANAFERAMVSVGASQKMDTDARGFRGIGRFAGLSYCRELIFRTSYAGEKTVSEIRWDGVQFKKLASDPNYCGDLKCFLKDIAEVSYHEEVKSPEHFFEVELKGVVRYKNDRLLNEKEIYDYLSQYAPVPFSSNFKYAEQIDDHLRAHGVFSTYPIYIEHDEYEQEVVRPYRDTFSLSEFSTDQFQELELVEIEGMHGGICAAGWILHHSYKGVIPERENIRGLRVRQGNIQIGKSNLLTDAFPEPRFNSWSVGEFHVVKRALVPTGRRDDFEVNARYADFVNKVATYGKNIAKICRQKSQERNRIKQFDSEAERMQSNLDILNQGAVSKRYRKELEGNISVSLNILSSIACSETLPAQTRKKLEKQLVQYADKVEMINGEDNLSEALAKHSPRDRRIYETIFNLIYECSANRIGAKKLVDQILLRLN